MWGGKDPFSQSQNFKAKGFCVGAKTPKGNILISSDSSRAKYATKADQTGGREVMEVR